MVKTFSEADKLPDGTKVIKDAPIFFNLKFSCKDADEIDKWVLKTIDNAEIIDVNTNLLKTPFGYCSKRMLSNSCKTALVANMLKKKGITKHAIDAISCGGNALDVLYQILDDTDIYILQHRLPTYDCKWKGTIDYDNGAFVGTPLRLMTYLL